MPLTHLVSLILRPGVQSIAVQYQVADSGVWITWNEGQRIIQGATVRFTVTVYTGFTLTDWKAWYADEYDDTVSIALTGVPGQSAWEFTMPTADVYIRCEAESSGSVPSGIIPMVEWSPGVQGIKEVVSYWSIQQMIKSLAYYYFGEYTENYSLVINGNLSSCFWGYVNNDGITNSYIRIAQLTTGSVIRLQIEVYTSQTPQTINYDNDPEGPAVSIRVSDATISALPSLRIDSESQTIVFNCATTDYKSISDMLKYGMRLVDGTRVYAHSIIVSPWDSLSEDMSIRYILSPENSGEVNGPDTYTDTSFTFTFHIKVGYSLKRITPFAVGDGPLEDDVLYSSAYDGETRTYTVTVQQIPDWAIGVRVLIECINHNDPNVGGDSKPGGGDGTFDETSDHIPIEPMPSISAADAGLITLFRPSLSELKSLGAYLWTNIDDFIVNLQKMFSNPMDTIIALNILPGLPPVGTPINIRLGLWETSISMPPVVSQWYEIDFGSVNVSEFWGSALDYSPNTKIHAMLPFIGSVQLNTDDVMGTTVGLVYRIDLLSGHLVAMITVNDEVLYQFTGECAVAVPLTGADWSRVYGAIAGTIGAVAIGAAGAAAAGATTAGLSQTAAAAQHVAAQADFDYMTAAISGASQGQLRALDSSARQLNAAAMNAVGRRNAAEAARVAGAVALGSNTVNQIMGAKFQIAHSGTISGSAGLLGVRRPYIYIEYPNQSLPDNYKHFYGYPSNMYANLGSLSGFTQCYQVLLTGVNGTDGEIAEILELLKEGVYL